MVPIANLQPLRLKKDQPIGFWFKSRIIPHGCKGLLHTAVHITGQKGSFCQNNKLTGPCLLGQVIAGFFGEVLLRLILLMRHRLKFSVKFNNTVQYLSQLSKPDSESGKVTKENLNFRITTKHVSAGTDAMVHICPASVLAHAETRHIPLLLLQS